MQLTGNRSEKLSNICKTLGGTTYFTGPAAKSYLDENVFIESGIEISYFNYEGYKEYPQLYAPFEHGVSIFDLILNCGENARNYLKYTNKIPNSQQEV